MAQTWDEIWPTIEYGELVFDMAQYFALLFVGAAIGIRVVGGRVVRHCPNQFGLGMGRTDCTYGVVTTVNKYALAAAVVGTGLVLVSVTLPIILERVET